MTDKWLTLTEIAELLSLTKGPVIRMAKLKNWPYRSYATRGGQERRYHLARLPEDVQAAYAERNGTTLEELRSRLKPASKPDKKMVIPRYSGRGARTGNIQNMDSFPEAYRTIAMLRVEVIKAYSRSGFTAARFVSAYANGEAVPGLRARLGPYGDISSQSSLYRWLERYQEHGMEGLVPQYRMRRGGNGASLPQEVKDRVEWLYLDTSRPSAASVIRDLEQYGLNCNGSIIRRYIKDIPAAVKVAGREGRDAYHKKFEAYKDRDFTAYKSMDCICGDYMTHDVICRIGQKMFRAKLCAFMDMRSRMIVGWSLQLTANSLGVIRSLQMCIERYGSARDVYVDNGKEFKNYWLCGDTWKERYTSVDPESLETDACILRECGMEIHFCLPYHGQSKPIERFWRTLHEMFDKHEITYVGSNTALRPEEMKVFQRTVNGIKKFDVELIPTFDDIRERIGNFMTYYNEKHHHTGQGMDEKTPLEVFQENAVPRRDIPENMRKYIFTRREIKTVQRNGITIDKMWYQSRELQEYFLTKGPGVKVEVRRGLDDVRTVSIFSMPERVYICDAEGGLENGSTEEDIRAVKKRIKEANLFLKKYNKAKPDYDKQSYKTPAELYAEEGRKVVGGEDLAASAPAGLALVKGKTKSGRTFEGLLGEVITVR
jgi:putative transposase